MIAIGSPLKYVRATVSNDFITNQRTPIAEKYLSSSPFHTHSAAMLQLLHNISSLVFLYIEQVQSPFSISKYALQPSMHQHTSKICTTICNEIGYRIGILSREHVKIRSAPQHHLETLTYQDPQMSWVI
jgi:hypothetical protein